MRRPCTFLLAGTLALGASGALAACSGGGSAEADPSGTTSATSSSTNSSSSSASSSSSGSSSSTTTPSSPSSSSSSPQGRRIEVTVTGKKVSPAPTTVRLGRGESLTLVVTSDHDDELHAHGFEVEKELAAGVATTMTLKGSEPGVFEVETHHPALVLMKIAVS